ncbi:MAG TPA: amino acid adenylation domain-containing protein, partial [Tahibacter sp.]|uniref:amino acid adenylation domain-containing protein n=1 Tax=Tahibacter sp. TaxID=2056211 RepID=UPI002C4850E3
AQYAETLPPLPRDRDVDGNGAIGTTRNVAITLTPEETRALQQHCHAAYRTQINELLLAGVYLGMRRWTGAAGLRLRLEGHGREALGDDLDLSQTLGWFTSLYPLVLRSAGLETGAVIKAIKEQYRAIPQRGLGYGVLRYLARDADLIAAADGQQESLVFNYLGQFDQVINETTRFQSASETIGPQVSLRRQRAAPLAFSGKIFGGQLQCGLNYSSDQYDAATMQTLATLIEDGLREVIRHCQQRDAGGFTPSDFPLAHVDQSRLDAWHADYPDLVRLYPATPMQAGLLFESLLERSAYVVQNHPILRGNLDTAAFRTAWQQVIARHDIFRTAFVGEGEAVHQLVSAQASLPWHEEDWRGLDAAEQQARFAAYRVADRRRGFDFGEAPLMRIALLRLSDDRWQLLWTLHHILLDGWCLPLVYRDVIAFYRAAVDGRRAALDTPPSYERYIAWLQARGVAGARAYWRGLLGGFDTPTPLVVDRLPGDGERGHREQRLELSVAQTQALQTLAQQQRTTVNTLVQWCWAYLLHRYSGEADVVFGATVSGRSAEVPGIEEMIGLFINTIPVKVSFDGNVAIAESVGRLHAEFQQSVEHGYLALPEIQRESRVRAGTALFDSLIVFENYPLDAVSGETADDTTATLEIEKAGNSEQTSFRLSLIASLGRTLEVKFGYRAEHFGEAAMQRLVGHFGRVLDQLPAALQTGRDIDLLDPAERAQFAEWNRTGSTFPDDVCIHEQIEAQVAATPDAIAVVAGDRTLSYAELNREANRLAHALIARGVRADDCVGLCMQRGADLVVAILGILKAGAAYLPLDPDYPSARLDYMLRDSGAAWVLTQQALAEVVPGDRARTLCLDTSDVRAMLAQQPAHDPTAQDRALAPHNIAYAIYTSGSTGEPKGVLNEHRALVNRLDWMQKAYALDADDRVLQKTPYSFDVSVWEFLWTLTTGARLVMLAPQAHKDPDALCAAIREHGITTLHFVPSMLSALLSAADWASCTSVRQVICSGEALGAELVARFFATGTPARLHNLYGPTEAAIDVSYWECRPEHAGHTVPIGRPIQNIALHVLDAQGRQQPVGVPGELHIGGVGLARGYCNKPELTAERFVRDHIDGGAAARLYRTGDLARWMPDGTLDYIGRIDHQVKIRGLRIELGEIETLLCRQPGVTDAVVVAHGSGEDRRLVAYAATLQPQQDPAEAAVIQRLRENLARELPDYMVPAVFVLLERLPLSANGKIDRKALPDPQIRRAAATLAGTATEAAIAAIWQRLLRLGEVDVLTSFFELGGHSLLAVRMLGEVRLHFGVTLAIRDVFERTTVRALSAFVDEAVQREALRQGLALDLADSNDQELIEL